MKFGNKALFVLELHGIERAAIGINADKKFVLGLILVHLPDLSSRVAVGNL